MARRTCFSWTAKPGDTQIGGLGVPHSWELDRAIVERVRVPVIIAGGLGPENIVGHRKLVLKFDDRRVNARTEGTQPRDVDDSVLARVGKEVERGKLIRIGQVVCFSGASEAEAKQIDQRRRKYVALFDGRELVARVADLGPSRR